MALEELQRATSERVEFVGRTATNPAFMKNSTLVNKTNKQTRIPVYQLCWGYKLDVRGSFLKTVTGKLVTYLRERWLEINTTTVLEENSLWYFFTRTCQCGLTWLYSGLYRQFSFSIEQQL